jgi:hypothetical protein
MVDRDETVKKAYGNLYFRAEFGEVTVSVGDTFTLDNFSATTDLKNVYIMKKSDGLEMTHTAVLGLNNVVSVTGAGTDVPCIYMAYGVKS